MEIELPEDLFERWRGPGRTVQLRDRPDLDSGGAPGIVAVSNDASARTCRVSSASTSSPAASGACASIPPATWPSARPAALPHGKVGIGNNAPPTALSVGSSAETDIALFSLKNDHGEVRFLVKGHPPSTEAAPVGSLYFDNGHARLYINTDGASGGQQAAVCVSGVAVDGLCHGACCVCG